MALRNLLHKNDLEAFNLWLLSCGGESRQPRGNYQVLQIRDLQGNWHVIYEKAAAKEHLSVPWPAVPLVEKFYRHKKAIKTLPELAQNEVMIQPSEDF